MKQFSNIISLGFRILMVILVFGSIISQPVIESMRISNPQVFSWLDIVAENDSSEKNTKEIEDEKNKKVELQIFDYEDTVFNIVKRASIFGIHFLKMDITIDTHDPPPELA